MPNRETIKIKETCYGGQITLIGGRQTKPYFRFTAEHGMANDGYIGYIEHRSAVKKLKRLCEEFLKQTETK